MNLIARLLLVATCISGGCTRSNSPEQARNVQAEHTTTDTATPEREETAPGLVESDQTEYAKAFREAEDNINKWHVIRQQHVVFGIESLSARGPGIAPYLISLTKSERYRQRGRSFWALVCGVLAKTGGDEGLAAMTDLTKDERAYIHAREYAEDTLAGEWPPSSANNRVEWTR